jgi:hypothetical protein
VSATVVKFAITFENYQMCYCKFKNTTTFVFLNLQYHIWKCANGMANSKTAVDSSVCGFGCEFAIPFANYQ